jgi:hypothetical protein
VFLGMSINVVKPLLATKSRAATLPFPAAAQPAR